MTGTDLCVNKCKQSRSYFNHLVYVVRQLRVKVHLLLQYCSLWLLPTHCYPVSVTAVFNALTWYKNLSFWHFSSISCRLCVMPVTDGSCNCLGARNFFLFICLSRGKKCSSSGLSHKCRGDLTLCAESLSVFLFSRFSAARLCLFETGVLVWADTPAVFTYTQPSLNSVPHFGVSVVLNL